MTCRLIYLSCGFYDAFRFCTLAFYTLEFYTLAFYTLAYYALAYYALAFYSFVLHSRFHGHGTLCVCGLRAPMIAGKQPPPTHTGGREAAAQTALHMGSS